MCVLFFSLIFPAINRFPPKLRVMCHCLYQVVCLRFPTDSFLATGTVIFLRFFNPALGNLQNANLVNSCDVQQKTAWLRLFSSLPRQFLILDLLTCLWGIAGCPRPPHTPPTVDYALSVLKSLINILRLH